jgi:hypothetical protein
MFGDERRAGALPLCVAALPGTAIEHSTAGAERAEPGLAGYPLAVGRHDSCPSLFPLAEFAEAVSYMCGTEPASPGTIKHRSVLSAGDLPKECVNWEHACIHSCSRYTGVRTSPRPRTSFTICSSIKMEWPASRSSQVFTRTSIGTSGWDRITRTLFRFCQILRSVFHTAPNGKPSERFHDQDIFTYPHWS